MSGKLSESQLIEIERENVTPMEGRKMDKPGDNPSSEAENQLQTLLTYQEGGMKSPFVTEVRVE